MCNSQCNVFLPHHLHVLHAVCVALHVMFEVCSTANPCRIWPLLMCHCVLLTPSLPTNIHTVLCCVLCSRHPYKLPAHVLVMLRCQCGSDPPLYS